jgi:hypothetical protein
MKLTADNVVELENGDCTMDIQYDEEALFMGCAWYKRVHGDEVDLDEDVVMQAWVIHMLEEQIKRDTKEETAIDTTDK